jgi:hypothetical protein
MFKRKLGESGSRFSIMNISANSKPKSEQLEMKCKGPMPNRFMQKPQKIRLVAMSLSGTIRPESGTITMPQLRPNLGIEFEKVLSLSFMYLNGV